MKQFTVGILAKNTVVNIETIRYYENIGLMQKQMERLSILPIFFIPI